MRTVLLLLLVAPVAVAQNPKPKPSYKSPTLGFTVIFPGAPKVRDTQLTTSAGTLDVHTTRFDVSSDLVLSVTVTDYPTEFAKVKPETLFAGILAEMKGADGKATEEGNPTLGDEKHPGRQWRIEYGKTAIRVRVFLVGTRLYQVMANGSKSGVDGAAVEELFKSFELVK